MQPLILTGMATANPLGLGLSATWVGLRHQRHGLRPNDFEDANVDTWIGRIDGVDINPLTGLLADFDCRNNRLALLGLRQDGFERAVDLARRKYGPDRIGVLIGTTTSGILETELAYRQRTAEHPGLPPAARYQQTQNLFSVSDVVRLYLRLTGPAASISTACSSSAKVFASASRLIEADLCDAVVAGGVDSLCFMTLYGFASLGFYLIAPAAPSTRTATGSRLVKPRASFFWSVDGKATGTFYCSAMARAAMRIICPRHTRKDKARQRRWNVHSSVQAETGRDRLCEPARYRNTGQ